MNSECRGRLRAVVACLVIAVLVVGMRLAIADVFPPEQRFVGMLSDGARVFADRPYDWGEEASQPKLANLAVFEPGRPFRWIVDQNVNLGPEPGAYVEFIGGDRLPGLVVDYQSALSDSFANPGEYLLVEPAVSVDLPQTPPSGFVRVSTDWLRRIVWERIPGAPPGIRPGTVLLRDGSQLPFKALRWSKGAVSVLMEDGVKSLLMSQLAEIHFPEKSPWESWFEQLGVLNPDMSARLIQIETGDGMRLTTSRTRYRQHTHGDKAKPDDWYPLLQPAWSLDPLVVPFRAIRSWRFFNAEEPPATLFDPVGRRAKPAFSGGWAWQINRNSQGGTLKSTNLLFGWGWGTHAPAELSMTLHPVVVGFRTFVGLDQVIRRGGCARSVVAYSNNVAAPLHRGEILIGPEKVLDTGWLTVTAPADSQVKLMLISDPVIAERPAGADPFDIRDCLDWLDPTWKLDPAKLKNEVLARLSTRIPSLRDWKVSASLDAVGVATAPAAGKSPLKLFNTWDALLAEDPHFRLDFEPAERFVVFQRKLSVGKQDRWLMLTLSRLTGGASTPSRVHVRINGKGIVEAPVPERVGRGDPDPIMIPVTAFRDQAIDVTVVVIGEGDKPRVDWRGTKLLTHHPGLVCLLDDDAKWLGELTDGEGDIAFNTDEKQTGKSSLKLTNGARGQGRINGMAFNVRETPRLGEYRFLRFAWKKIGGTEIGLQLGHDGQLGTLLDGRKKPHAIMANTLRYRHQSPPDNRGATYGYQYDIGNNKDVSEPTLRLEKKPTGNWEAHSRDVFGEFGSFQITGLGFRCPDDGTAYFDGIFLARTQEDFLQWPSEWNDVLAPEPPHPDPNVGEFTDRAWRFGGLLAKFAPQFTTDASWEGVRILKNVAGKEAVRTHPPAQGKPCVLRCPVTIDAAKKTLLKITCGRRMDGDWQLAVVVEGQDLLRVMVDGTTAKDGWVNHEVDLSRFAGKNVVVEVHNIPNSWPNEDAYWSQVRIETP